MSKWIDISVPLRTGMVHWPGDLPPRLERVASIEGGDVYNARELHMNAHIGTHMDAPMHFLRDGAGIDTMPFEATIGPVRVIQILDTERITPEELEPQDLQPGERILLKTVNSSRIWQSEEFQEKFVHIDARAAKYFADRRVKTIGIDCLSVGAYGGDIVETHQILLGAGIWIIEGLNLSAVEPGRYELICLPIKIQDGDGAPARAILRSIE